MELFDVGSSKCVNDERLARRLKRRWVSTGNSELNTCSSTLKRTLEDSELGDEMDEDYKSFLYNRGSAFFIRESDDYVRDEEDDADPQYKMFLENMREDGNSYQLEVTLMNGMSLLIRYERECGLHNELELQTARKSGDSSNGEKVEARKDVTDVRGKDKVETQKNSRNILRKDKMESPKTSENCIVDECYQAFLNGVEQEGECIVFLTEDGKRIKYGEEDIDSSSDLEIFEIDNAPSNNPFVTSRMFDSSLEGDNWQCLGNSSRSQFREKVISILRRPYDQEEYEELLRNIKEKKPVKRFIDLRSGPVSYQASNNSKSYLDHFADLKLKIEVVRFDRRKGLNLLRGFFYWLQNLSHEGSFRPWLDSSCLEVLPGNR